MELYSAIQKRISDRKYTQKELPGELLDWLGKRLETLIPLYPEISTRYVLIREPGMAQSFMKGMIGSYGKIDSPYCIVAISENKAGFMENAGFMQEQLVLELTDKGLGTCWVGGSFSMEKTRGRVNPAEDEVIADILALGYAKDSMYNRGLRRMLGCSKRLDRSEVAFFQAWGRDSSEFLAKNPALSRILGMSNRYPSAVNQQPVRVVLNDGKAVILTRSSEGKYKEAAPMDAGIFMAHFYLSCLEEGLKVEWVHDEKDEQGIGAPKGFSYVMTLKYE